MHNKNNNKTIFNMETKDRHKEGYYKEYAERTGKKDRHSADYYKKYRERKKLEKEASSNVVSSSDSNTEKNKKSKAKKKDRRAYYREYNKKHPERLNRGFTKGYVNGNVSDGAINTTGEIYGMRILGYDEIGRPITNCPLSDLLRNKEMEWHDDDWCEEPD